MLTDPWAKGAAFQSEKNQSTTLFKPSHFIARVVGTHSAQQWYGWDGRAGWVEEASGGVIVQDEEVEGGAEGEGGKAGDGRPPEDGGEGVGWTVVSRRPCHRAWGGGGLQAGGKAGKASQRGWKRNGGGLCVGKTKDGSHTGGMVGFAATVLE